MDRIPSVEYIYLDLLSSSLDGGDFLVRDGLPKIIIANLSEVTLADE